MPNSSNSLRDENKALLVWFTILLTVSPHLLSFWGGDSNPVEEAAEDAVINAIKAGLEQYATEQMMSQGNRQWPANPWDALETKPAGWNAASSADAANDGEWRWKASTSNITHMRNDGTVWHWDYDPDNNVSDGDQVVGTLGDRTTGVGN